MLSWQSRSNIAFLQTSIITSTLKHGTYYKRQEQEAVTAVQPL